MVYAYQLTGLVSGATYYWAVQPYDQGHVAFGCPDQEQSIASSGQITATWLPFTMTVGYRVFWGTASQDYTQSMDVGTNLQATITGLTSGQTYYFVTQSYDGEGAVSCFSGEAHAVAP